jgi:hypothetical protein
MVVIDVNVSLTMSVCVSVCMYYALYTAYLKSNIWSMYVVAMKVCMCT